MSKVSEELRARAVVLDRGRAGWVQTEPRKPGQLCAVFDYGTDKCQISMSTLRKLETWLYRFVREQYPKRRVHDQLISVTMFNDEVVRSVDEVITAFEKAAADLD